MEKQDIIDTNDIPPEELDLQLISGLPLGPKDKRFQFHDKDTLPERDRVMKAEKSIYDDPPPPDPKYRKTNRFEQIRLLRLQKTSEFRKLLGEYKWLEIFELHGRELKENASTVAAIVMQNNLVFENNNHYRVVTKNYGSCFNLCPDDPFYSQPIATGAVCTCVLVKEDVVATTAPWVTGKNMMDFRIVFGYHMQDTLQPSTNINSDNIYRPTKIISHADEETNWSLVKLDRKVNGRAPALLSDDDLFDGQTIHVIGHPVGLPAKFISGPYITDVQEEHVFTANLGFYGSGSGSPVFCHDSDELLGLVQEVDYPGLRWTGTCWVSVVNVPTGMHSPVERCIGVGAFADALNSL